MQELALQETPMMVIGQGSRAHLYEHIITHYSLTSTDTSTDAMNKKYMLCTTSVISTPIVKHGAKYVNFHTQSGIHNRKSGGVGLAISAI